MPMTFICDQLPLLFHFSNRLLGRALFCKIWADALFICPVVICPLVLAASHGKTILMAPAHGKQSQPLAPSAALPLLHQLSIVA